MARTSVGGKVVSVDSILGSTKKTAADVADGPPYAVLEDADEISDHPSRPGDMFIHKAQVALITVNWR